MYYFYIGAAIFVSAPCFCLAQPSGIDSAEAASSTSIAEDRTNSTRELGFFENRQLGHIERVVMWFGIVAMALLFRWVSRNGGQIDSLVSAAIRHSKESIVNVKLPAAVKFFYSFVLPIALLLLLHSIGTRVEEKFP